ncbi:MAG: rRNA adenine methyltransferase, partial [Bacteroidales bacterium]|nr:rRNA adenine methyltransferase [Bacteroidales bacterium]
MTKKNSIPVRYSGQHFTIDQELIKDAIDQANLT